jgi:hypothetical protein
VSDRGDVHLPLTSAQSGVWYAQQLNPRSTVFNAGEFLEIGGPVDAGRLALARVRIMGFVA